MISEECLDKAYRVCHTWSSALKEAMIQGYITEIKDLNKIVKNQMSTKTGDWFDKTPVGTAAEEKDNRKKVRVDFNGSQYTFIKNGTLLSSPSQSGESWIVLDNDTGKISYISEPCTITEI